MRKTLDQLRSFVAELEPRQRWTLLGAVLAALVAAVGVGIWSWQDRYEQVYSSDDAGDIADVAAELDTQSIPYQISADGRSILVLPEFQGRARVAGASAGADEGFVVLDHMDIGASPQRERWTYQRALQGELAQTIASLQEVDWARVHLVMPEQSVFLRDEAHASASVTVRLKAGGSLGKGKVVGITALVAGAVKGLSQSDVVLVDQAGRLYSGGEDPTQDSVASLATQRAAEAARTRGAIVEALQRVFGSPDDISVGVTVDLDPSSIDRTKVAKDPDSAVVISEVLREDKSNSTQPGGIPGTSSNLPEETAKSTDRTTSQESTEQRTNYSHTQLTEHETVLPGTIKRLSVGVVVNSERIKQLAAAAAADDEGLDADALQEDLKKRIEETVSVTMGYDESRGDQLVVEFLPFSETAALGTSSESASTVQQYTDYLPYAVAALGLVLLFVVVLRPVVKAATATPPPASAPLDEETRSQLKALGMTEDELAALPGGESRPGQQLAERLRSMVDNYESVEAQELNQLVGLEEESTANVLRRWIRDR